MATFTVTLENSLDNAIFLSQSGKEDYTFQPDIFRKIFVDESTCIHGHSEIGSFIMTLVDQNSVQFRTWGNLTIVKDKIGDEVVFRIHMT